MPLATYLTISPFISGEKKETLQIEYNGITHTAYQFRKAYPNGRLINLVTNADFLMTYARQW